MSWSSCVASSMLGRCLTTPCSRRAAGQRDPRREHPGPRPAAEAHVVRHAGSDTGDLP